MLQFVSCLFLALGASASSNNTAVLKKLRNDDVVTAVENTLKVCSGIASHMWNFSNMFDAKDDRRRNDETDDSLVDGVGRKLNTCSKIFDAVITGRADYCKGSDLDQEDHEEVITTSHRITFNVGGTLFSTNLSTLLSVNGTKFEREFRGGETRTSSSDETYFIDRSPRTFGYVIDYLRTGDLFIGRDAGVRIQLLDDAEFYQLPREVLDYLRWKPINGIELWLSEVRYLNQLLNLVRQKMGEVLYEAAQDGDSASRFHSLCDSKGATVVIILTSTGNVFGGYSSTDWTSTSGYGTSSTAFLFRLRPANPWIKRYDLKSAGNSIYRHASYGPRFGSGDIYLQSNALTSHNNYVSGSFYSVSGYELNNGVRTFKVQDYAVVKAIPL